MISASSHTVFVVLVERSSMADDAAYVQSVYSNETDACDALVRWLRKHPEGLGRIEGPLRIIA
mgnify:CR=1 FL=1